MEQTEAWLETLRGKGRKENTILTHRGNVRQCLLALDAAGYTTDANNITENEVLHLWEALPVKENVRWSYIRSFSQMIEFHTGRDVVKNANILHNRCEKTRVFINKDEFSRVYSDSNPFERVILCLGAYMGLRRVEMASIRDCDIHDGMILIHGKGHGTDGHVVHLRMPQPVIDSIAEYRLSDMKRGIREDDYLLQSRSRMGHLHKVTTTLISETVSNMGQRIGIKMTTHSLRRFFATTLYYDVGCDLQTMRNLMRHADVATTLKCYVNADERKEMEASEKLTILITGLVNS